MKDILRHLTEASAFYIVIVRDADMIMVKVVFFSVIDLRDEARVVSRYIP